MTKKLFEKLNELKKLSGSVTPVPWRYAQIIDGIETRALVDYHGYHFGRIDDPQNGELACVAVNNFTQLLTSLETCIRALEKMKDVKVGKLKLETIRGQIVSTFSDECYYPATEALTSVASIMGVKDE